LLALGRKLINPSKLYTSKHNRKINFLSGESQVTRRASHSSAAMVKQDSVAFLDGVWFYSNNCFFLYKKT
jgi:hypothetical protein